MTRIMTDQQMLRYLKLVDRLLWIMRHSGVHWKPEYEEEGYQIRAELENIEALCGCGVEEKKCEERCENSCGIRQVKPR